MGSCCKKIKNEGTKESCCFGKYLQEECHQKTKVEIKLSSEFTEKDKTVYKWRAGLQMTEDSVTTICKYQLFYSDLFFKKHSKCCNIYNSHKKKKKPDGTHNITLEMAEQLKHKEINVIPGWKLCHNCHQKTKDLADDEVGINECDDGDVNEFETSLQIVQQRDLLNKSFGIISISPLKTHAVAKTTKTKAACDRLEQSFEKQKKMIKEIFKLPDTSQLDTKEIVIEKDIQKKADDFDRLMLLIKDKLNDNSLKISRKLQILTVAPDWLRAHVAKYFNVSEHMVCEARKLAREKGIQALLDPKRGKCLSKEVENSVKLFYENDEYLWLMPGAKDYVSVTRNVHQQKHQLL